MNKRNWGKLAKELQSLFDFGGYKGTKVTVTVSEDGLDVKSATNDKTTFYHVEEVAVFCKCKMLNSFITIIDGEIVCRVY